MPHSEDREEDREDDLVGACRDDSAVAPQRFNDYVAEDAKRDRKFFLYVFLWSAAVLGLLWLAAAYHGHHHNFDRQQAAVIATKLDDRIEANRPVVAPAPEIAPIVMPESEIPAEVADAAPQPEAAPEVVLPLPVPLPDVVKPIAEKIERDVHRAVHHVVRHVRHWVRHHQHRYQDQHHYRPRHHWVVQATPDQGDTSWLAMFFKAAARLGGCID